MAEKKKYSPLDPENRPKEGTPEGEEYATRHIIPDPERERELKRRKEKRETDKPIEDSTNNKFDKRLEEIYKTLMVEGPAVATGAKTGMDIAVKLAQDYESKPFGSKAWHDTATGGAGKRATGVVKKYHDVAMDAAENELNSMKNQATVAKADANRRRKEAAAK